MAALQQAQILQEAFLLEKDLPARWDHRKHDVVTRVNSPCKSAWVDAMPGHVDAGSATGYGSIVTAASVRELCQQGQLDEAVEALEILVQTGSRISQSLFYTALRNVVKKDLVLGRRVHALTVKRGCESDTYLSNHILRMYASHGRLQEAMDVFTAVAKPDAFMWSSIISAHVKHGQAEQAIQLYHRMRSSSVEPDSHVFAAALQACGRMSDLRTGQQLHADVLASGFEPDSFLRSGLVYMYAKCGSLEDAQRVFDGLGQKDVVTWTALISGYSQQGKGLEALRLYSAMQQGGIVAPDSVTFVCLLQACASIGASALNEGKQIHAQIRGRSLQTDVVIVNSLIHMYGNCGNIDNAQRVFDDLIQKDVVTWTTLIAGYAHQGLGWEALHLYTAMQEEGIASPNSVTFVCLLQACAVVGSPALDQGKQLHAQIGHQGFQVDMVLGCSVVNMYAKCGSLEDAQRVFDKLSQKDVVTWNAMIAGYSQQNMGQKALRLYSAMREEGVTQPNSVTFVSLLQACATMGNSALAKGKQLHAEIQEQGLQGDVFVANTLVYMYAQCGSQNDAKTIFGQLVQKDVVTWNAMIAGYYQQGMGLEALHLYRIMRNEGVALPDSVTFVCLLQACASIGAIALVEGKQLHAQIKQQGLEADVRVANCLVNMYAKCGSLDCAQNVFDKLARKDVVTWTCLIGGYSQQRMGEEVLDIYYAMEQEAIAVPDAVTFVSLLHACASVGPSALEKGKRLHAEIERQGLQDEMLVANTLVHMYATCGSLVDAHCVFDRLSVKDVVTWTSLLAGYSQHGMCQEALSLYGAMQEEGITPPDSVTFVCLLQACASVAALNPGRQLHAEIEKQGLQGNVLVAVSLLNMYAHCGSMGEAQRVFDALPERDIDAWNALIAGYTRQGDCELVFDLVHRMRQDGLQPDGVTLLSVLTVCSHAGLTEKGREYFEAMSTQYGIPTTLEHQACLVDLLGRAGQLDEALAVARAIPAVPPAGVWRSLLCACQKWSNIKVASHVFKEAMQADKQDATAYVLMSNIYTGAKMWPEAQEMQARRIRNGARKQPGQTWWTDMDWRVHSFVVGDLKHPEN